MLSCRLTAGQAIIPTWVFVSRWRLPLVVLVCRLPSRQLWAFKDFVMPQAENASTYPSKDSHPNEKITVAIDLYNTAPKDEVFTTHYRAGRNPAGLSCHHQRR